jgi:hypothetical protein
MNTRFYQDIDTMFEFAAYSDDGAGFSLWGSLWAFAEAMWLTGHEEEADG